MLRIHTRFLDALSELSKKDQKKVRELIRKISENGGVGRGSREHKVGSFTSLSVGMDLRVLAVKEPGGLTLVYVDHHDDAYQWGNKNRIVIDDDEMLIALIPTTTSDIAHQQVQTSENSQASSRFAGLPRPIASVLEQIADEQELLVTIAALSPEWQEAALESALSDAHIASPSDIIAVDDKLLDFALQLPAEKWRVFLHTAQRAAVDHPTGGLLLLGGAAGTGKSICLVHRFVRLGRLQPKNHPVLLAPTTSICDALEGACKSLGYTPPKNSIRMFSNDGLAVLDACSSGGSCEVLVDDAQDLSIQELDKLLADLASGMMPPSLTLGYDPNQAALLPTGDALNRLRQFSDSITLTYCYRMTSEILEYSNRILDLLYSQRARKLSPEPKTKRNRFYTGSVKIRAVLTGPEVDIRRVKPSEVVAETLQSVQDLRNDASGQVEVGVIMVLHDETVAAALMTSGVPTYSVQSSRGLEFLRGVVVNTARSPTTNETIAPTANYSEVELRLIYVAITRFRDRLVVIEATATE